MRYTFHYTDGSPVLDCYGEPYKSDIGPKAAADTAKELAQKTGRTVFWADNARDA